MTVPKKPRARRIAADEAHAWARNLKLGNIHAKLILSMLTLYVDGEGAAFVAIPSLAEDCELSPDTVRRRLAWLEHIGAIVRISQWIDENGNRNGNGRGKRTTDLIRLQTDVDTDAIEARAAGGTDAEMPAETEAISPSCQQGLNQPQDSVSPAPALGQPSHCGEGLISEPEPEIAVAADARDPLISKSAMDLAEQLLVIAGHDLKFWPPGWCGAPMRVQTWLTSGWNPEIIIAATRGAMARRTGPPPNSVTYFEKAIAEEVVRQSRPLPEVTHAVQANRNSRPDRSTGAAYDRLRQRLNANQDSSGGGDGSGASAVPMLAQGRGPRS